MARQLWLLRHADAEPHGARADFERLLTERGEMQARAAGAALLSLGVSFETVLSSPRVRALRTAQLAAEQHSELRPDAIEVDQALSGGFDGGDALALLANTGNDGALLLVGHEPDFSSVVRELTGANIDLKKGGIAALRLDGGAAELLILLRPHELALIAGVEPSTITKRRTGSSKS